ncbi:response regulator [Paenibacillus hexagrammi]|uniref:Response regulator n=1 Tax=Paenibacillus hexagrammi TaxID=2908839 RepID=A0ABY3SKM9_9BACL|nr:response regulator [Paenibacillus sp. YPD9-1]UJF34511.1 response regulator [Paenibacillus sp. YPD9-1]
MLKAIVCDDEYIVLQGLQAMIDWAGFGIELVGTAGDGHAALALFRNTRPDIVFTDIRMPGMDGLELIYKILNEAPETYCIVFSGFNEFEYVKKAIQLGVADYLEKPVTVPSIEKSLQKVLDRIRQQQEINEVVLAKATLDLLLIGTEAESKWLHSFGENASRVCGVTVAASGAVTAVFPKHEDYFSVAVRNGQERMLVFFHYQWPTLEFWEHLAYEFESAGMPVGCGKTYSQIAKASISCTEALRALRSAYFLGEQGVVRFEDLGDLGSAPDGLTEREEAIILSIRTGNRSVLMEQLEQFIKWLQLEKLELEVAEHKMLKLIYLALEEAKKTGADKAQLAYEHYKPHVDFREMAAKGKVAEWFREQLLQIAEAGAPVSSDSVKHSSVERARSFIAEHCTRDLSLQEVAEHVGMNPTYFSVLFKEEIGESYIKYVTRYRMELAKSLLSKGLKVNDVSEKVGYHTYRHFSEVFKKYTGLTPGQFKEQA